MLLLRNIFDYYLIVFALLLLKTVEISTVLLNECPGYDVTELRQNADKHEISFLFYHVAWNNDSQTARAVFEHIARDYHDMIYFAAIDCYHLACNCTKTHPHSLGSGSPNRWPTLVIRYGNRTVLQYNGEWTFKAIKRLINSLMVPVEMLNTREELNLLTMYRDAIVLGIFKNVSQVEYRMFVSASIKWLETDPESSFRFAAAISEAGKDILNRGVGSKPDLPQLLLITSKKIDVASIEWNVSSIVLWLQTEFVGSLNVLYGYSSPKSLTMNLHVSPVMAIVANDNFYEYMDNITTPAIALKKLPANTWQEEIVELQELEYVRHTFEKNELLNPFKCHAKEYVSLWNLRYYYALDSYLKKFLCGLRYNCKYERYFLSRNSSASLGTSSPSRKIAAAKYLKNIVETNWHDFKSQQNQSLSVVILDYTKHLDFLHTQGIRHANDKNLVTMIIADRLEEKIYVSQSLFTFDTLKQFVRSYYSKNLVAYKTGSMHTKSQVPKNKIVIENVNKEIFLNKLDQANFTTIALLYSPQCTFSALASQTIIQLAAFLGDSSVIQIIRINTLWNDLPWELKMANTPTLIVFPRGRISDSRVFPTYMEYNVRNVFNFALAQMEPVDQFKTLLSCCKRQKLHSIRMQKCVQYLRALVAHRNSDQKIIAKQIATAEMAEWNALKLELKMNFPLY